MWRDSTVIRLRQPEAIDDPLSELARENARRMLAQVLIADADSFVAMWKALKLPDGRDRVVRHGHGPHRAIQTGVGPVEVRRAKGRGGQNPGAADEEARCAVAGSHLRGVSTGDFQEALAALLGKDAPNLSPAVDLAADGRMADGLRRLAEARPLGAAIRVRVGGRSVPASPNGRRRRMHAGADRRNTRGREGTRRLPHWATWGAQSWRELLIGIKQRGLEIAPDLAVGDGALGFWKAIEEVFPSTRHQRCWVHKTANVLNKVALTGTICARQTRSRACSRRCVIEPCGRRGPCRRRPPS